MTFYDSNGENCTINGTAETLARHAALDLVPGFLLLRELREGH